MINAANDLITSAEIIMLACNEKSDIISKYLSSIQTEGQKIIDSKSFEVFEAHYESKMNEYIALHYTPKIQRINKKKKICSICIILLTLLGIILNQYIDYKAERKLK